MRELEIRIQPFFVGQAVGTVNGFGTSTITDAYDYLEGVVDGAMLDDVGNKEQLRYQVDGDFHMANATASALHAAIGKWAETGSYGEESTVKEDLPFDTTILDWLETILQSKAKEQHFPLNIAVTRGDVLGYMFSTGIDPRALREYASKYIDDMYNQRLDEPNTQATGLYTQLSWETQLRYCKAALEYVCRPIEVPSATHPGFTIARALLVETGGLHDTSYGNDEMPSFGIGEENADGIYPYTLWINEANKSNRYVVTDNGTQIDTYFCGTTEEIVKAVRDYVANKPSKIQGADMAKEKELPRGVSKYLDQATDIFLKEKLTRREILQTPEVAGILQKAWKGEIRHIADGLKEKEEALLLGHTQRLSDIESWFDASDIVVTYAGEVVTWYRSSDTLISIEIHFETGTKTIDLNLDRNVRISRLDAVAEGAESMQIQWANEEDPADLQSVILRRAMWSAPKAAIPQTYPLQGQNIVFAGFRDADLGQLVVKLGGRLNHSVSEKSTLVITLKKEILHKSTSKLKKAETLGIETMSRGLFKNWVFSVASAYNIECD
jgi:hypothetical protein